MNYHDHSSPWRSKFTLYTVVWVTYWVLAGRCELRKWKTRSWKAPAVFHNSFFNPNGIVSRCLGIAAPARAKANSSFSTSIYQYLAFTEISIKSSGCAWTRVAETQAELELWCLEAIGATSDIWSTRTPPSRRATDTGGEKKNITLRVHHLWWHEHGLWYCVSAGTLKFDFLELVRSHLCC